MLLENVEEISTFLCYVFSRQKNKQHLQKNIAEQYFAH